MSDEVEGPGRVVTYPAGMTTMVFAMFGVQSVDDTHTEPFVAALRQLFAGAHGPRSVERCHHHDDVSGHNTILMAYWTDLGEATAFLESAPFSTWWEARPTDDDRVGHWREILTPQVGRFHYFGVGPHRVGATAVLPVSGTDKFGYWGGYRDRMADSPADPFDSPLAELPTRGPTVSTRGRRVTVDAPHNLCFVREGADTSHITSQEEQQVWDELLEPASKKWITYLAENPRTSGCCPRTTSRAQRRTA
ncbi:phenylacetaldoxime dehydratase family protein [Pseudonocardia dioxanivorans]|uniref:phenylacetaldoxime dehydratase family protein n=1 Tax=Pseudonocardia dioxanivorans TaxID=240495 RepID=UPI00131A544F|nr:phenylacetaldoxime dehydratase family protein [Pseudonocardia dioxanivorans]